MEYSKAPSTLGNLEIHAHSQAKTHSQKMSEKTLNLNFGLICRLSTSLAKCGNSALTQNQYVKVDSTFFPWLQVFKDVSVKVLAEHKMRSRDIGSCT